MEVSQLYKVRLLTSDKVFVFSSVQELRRIDPFEGTLPGGNQKLRLPPENDFYREMDQLGESVALSAIVVNCWHLNPNESAAMWRLYLRGGEGVAIQSTYEDLKKCFADRSDTPHSSDRQTPLCEFS